MNPTAPQKTPKDTQQQPQQQQKAAPVKAQAAPKLTPEQRLQRILNPEAKAKAASGDDILAAAKKKQQAKAKNPPAKQANQPKKTPKEAPKGQSDSDDDVLGDATGEDDEADLTEGNDAQAYGKDNGAADDDGNTDDEPNDEGDDAEATDEAEDDGTLYKVKVAGKELEVPLSELLKGYSRTADYQQKTAAVAKERKEVEAIKETVKDLPQQRETYVKGAERFSTAAVVMMQAMQQKFMPKPPAPELAQTDPAAYFAQQTACHEAQQFTGALQQELVNIQGNLERDGKARHAAALQESRKKLYEAMPDMAQPVARQKLREYANSLGFSDEAIAQEANHVLFVCVEKARRWDELQQNKANVKPKAKTPKVEQRTNAVETKRAQHIRDKQTVLSEHKQKGTIKSAEKALQRLFSS